MNIELSYLLDLLAGRRRFLTVGDLPRPVADHLRCHPAVVYLRNLEARKIWETHQEVTGIDLLQMSLALTKGCYYADPKRARCVTSIYTAENGKPYVLGLKSADNGHEVWVATYYRTNADEVARRFGRWGVIRPAKK